MPGAWKSEYSLYLGQSPYETTQFTVGENNSGNILISGLEYGGQYWFYITQVDQYGYESERSNVLSVILPRTGYEWYKVGGTIKTLLEFDDDYTLQSRDWIFPEPKESWSVTSLYSENLLYSPAGYYYINTGNLSNIVLVCSGRLTVRFYQSETGQDFTPIAIYDFDTGGGIASANPTEFYSRIEIIMYPRTLADECTVRVATMQ
jgi:hypothetical protein